MKPVSREPLKQGMEGATVRLAKYRDRSSPKRPLYVAALFGFFGLMVIGLVLGLGPKSGEKANQGCWINMLPFVRDGFVSGCVVSDKETVIKVSDDKWYSAEDSVKEMILSQIDFFLRQGGRGTRAEVRGNSSGSIYWQKAYSGRRETEPMKKVPLIPKVNQQKAMPYQKGSAQNPYLDVVTAP